MNAKEFLDKHLGWEGQPPQTIKYEDVVNIMALFEIRLRIEQLKETSDTNPIHEIFGRVEKEMKKYRTENY